MLGALFCRSRETQHIVGLPVACGNDIGQFGLAFGDGPRFVEQHRTYRVDALQALPAFDQDTLFSAFAGANHDSGRRG